MAAISEYAALATRKTTTFQPPSNLGEVARWLFIGLGIWLALRILLGALRLLTRR